MFFSRNKFFLDQNLFLDTFFFGPKICLDQNLFWTNNFFGLKFLLTQTTFVDQKFYWTSNWPSIFMDPKKFSDIIFFWIWRLQPEMRDKAFPNWTLKTLDSSLVKFIIKLSNQNHVSQSKSRPEKYNLALSLAKLSPSLLILFYQGSIYFSFPKQ